MMKKRSGLPVNPPEPDVPSQDKEFLKELRAVIEKNLSDPKLTVDFLSKKLLIGRTTLWDRVNKITDKSPNQYIKSYRLERAAQLFEKNFGNVTEVAMAVGFGSSQYFSNCFRKEFGQSPTSYINSHLLEDKRIRHFGRAVTATRRKLPPKLMGKDIKKTHQWEEIFEQVMLREDVDLVVDEALEHFTALEFIKKVKKLIADRQKNIKKFGGNMLTYLDFYNILNEPMRKNAHSVAAVCMAKDIFPDAHGKASLTVKNYGETFNLHVNEPFSEQPIGVGRMGTGVLMGDNIILTAAHLANQDNVTDLRFIFGFLMQNPITPVIEIPTENIYHGLEIINRVHSPDADWALIKLDRRVTDRGIVSISQSEIFKGQPVYIAGYPCGLPLKLELGPKIGDINDSYFKSDLNVYGGSGGSPVFCAETHKLLGIVSRAKVGDFMWTGNGWLTIPYPKDDIDNDGSQCTKVSPICEYIGKQ